MSVNGALLAVAFGALCSLASPAVEAHRPAVDRDIAYGSDPAQRLDLTVPPGRNFPTIIFIHGGSLSSGDKSDTDYGKVCDAFPAAGIACANVNYRLTPASAWPAQPDDVASAVAWVRANIGARGGDPGRLFLLGHSSGAMLVALVAADGSYLARAGVTSTALRGVMPIRRPRAGDREGRAGACRGRVCARSTRKGLWLARDVSRQLADSSRPRGHASLPVPDC